VTTERICRAGGTRAALGARGTDQCCNKVVRAEMFLLVQLYTLIRVDRIELGSISNMDKIEPGFDFEEHETRNTNI
jgi:hypothetical protein